MIVAIRRALGFAAAILVVVAGVGTSLAASDTAVSPSNVVAQASPTPQPQQLADVVATVRVSPSVSVAPGGTLRYTIRLQNFGGGTAYETWVRIPYHRDLVVWQVARVVPYNDDYVTYASGDTIEVHFGALGAGAIREATLLFETYDWLSNGTLIDTRATYNWRDNRNGSMYANANWTPVLIGATNIDSELVWASSTPAAAGAGTDFVFLSDRFYPGEIVRTWLNTPGGPRDTNLNSNADSNGTARFELSSTGFAPGKYGFVIQGDRSRFTAIAEFTIR